MKIAHVSAVLAAVFLMAFTGPLLDEDKIPPARAKRDTAIELCHAKWRAYAFKTNHDYGLCFTAAVRAYYVAIAYADMDVIDAWAERYMLITDERDKNLVDYKTYAALIEKADQDLADTTNAEIRAYEGATAMAASPDTMPPPAPAPLFPPAAAPQSPPPTIHCTTIAGPLVTNTDCR
jgi:hypothetical protein